MGELKKYSGGVMMLNKHYDRLLQNDNNKDIDPERTHLNYSIPMDHGGLSANEYYQKIVGDNYLYGRGTKREDKAITACSWVITAPAEIADDQEKVKAFFQTAIFKKFFHTKFRCGCQHTVFVFGKGTLRPHKGHRSKAEYQ